MYCRFCGKMLAENSRFCHFCGKSVNSKSNNNMNDSIGHDRQHNLTPKNLNKEAQEDKKPKIIALECPNCHAAAKLRNNSSILECAYCGTTSFLQDDVKRTSHTRIDVAEIERIRLEKDILEHKLAEREKEREDRLRRFEINSRMQREYSKAQVIKVIVICFSVIAVLILLGIIGHSISKSIDTTAVAKSIKHFLMILLGIGVVGSLAVLAFKELLIELRKLIIGAGVVLLIIFILVLL